MIMTKNSQISQPSRTLSLLPYRRRLGRYVAFGSKPHYTYDYNNVWIRKVLDSNGDGTADSKTIFIPENYQTTVQLDDANLTDANAPAITHHYLWTPNQQDKLLADVTANNVLWSLTDHLGSIRDVVQQTSTGLVVPAHIIYDAYGNIISCKNSEGQTVNNLLLFAYTGKPFDTDTQLQNNINRWYDATVGRWLSQDPIGFEGNDTNLYRYVYNSPIVYIDYLGFSETGVTNSSDTFQSRPLSIEEQRFLLSAMIISISKSITEIRNVCENKKNCVTRQQIIEALTILPYVGQLKSGIEMVSGDFSGATDFVPNMNNNNLSKEDGRIVNVGKKLLSSLNFLETINNIYKLGQQKDDIDAMCYKIIKFLDSEQTKYVNEYKRLISKIFD